MGFTMRGIGIRGAAIIVTVFVSVRIVVGHGYRRLIVAMLIVAMKICTCGNRLGGNHTHQRALAIQGRCCLGRRYGQTCRDNRHDERGNKLAKQDRHAIVLSLSAPYRNEILRPSARKCRARID